MSCYHLLRILKPCCNYHCICASLRVHSEIWGKNNFLSFKKKCLFSVFLHIEAQLSVKNARLPPVFFLDFNSGWYDLLVSQSLSRKKYFTLVGTVLKWLNKGYVSSIERRGAYLFFFFYMCDSYLKAAPFQLKAVEYFII